MEHSEQNELERWRTNGRALWPFVRFFGLCGADPQAMEAVAELADLLGESVRNAAATDSYNVGVSDGRQRLATDLLRRIDEEKIVMKIGRNLTHELKELIVNMAGGG